MQCICLSQNKQQNAEETNQNTRKHVINRETKKNHDNKGRRQRLWHRIIASLPNWSLAQSLLQLGVQVEMGYGVESSKTQRNYQVI